MNDKRPCHWFRCSDGRACGIKKRAEWTGAQLCLCNWDDKITMKDLEEANWRCGECTTLNPDDSQFVDADSSDDDSDEDMDSDDFL